MENITDGDYVHAKDCKDFNIKNLGEYHDLYVQSDTSLLADVFEHFQNMCLAIYELDPSKFLSASGLAWQEALKETKAKLDLLTDVDMLLMVEKGIRGRICHCIYRYAKSNNKYMKDYDKNKESSYIQYWDVNNLCGWAMSQQLPVDNFEWIKDTSQFNEDFIKNYNEESDEGYFLEDDVQYLEKLHELHNDLPFLLETMKIEKIEKLVANFHDKTEYVIHIRNLKQALNHALVLKKVHRVIKFNQNAWLKSYIDMNTDLREKAKNDFEKGFLKLMNNAVFGKTMEPKYGEKEKLCYMDGDSFIVYIKNDDIYKDIAKDVETRFDTSNYELDRLLPKAKNKKVIGLMKDELGGKIKTKFVGLREKTYSYLIDDSSDEKKQKAQKSLP